MSPAPVLPPPFLPVCKEAKADLVFLVDGSWSIGDDNFLKIIRFLYSTTGALDRIGSDGTQVPRTGPEPPLKEKYLIAPAPPSVTVSNRRGGGAEGGDNHVPSSRGRHCVYCVSAFCSFETAGFAWRYLQLSDP